jgi:hypothetical protein
MQPENGGWKMKIPVIRGVIERRILVNYRVDSEVMARQLPPPFRPKLTPDGSAVAGICLIRLSEIRPGLVPAVFGITSENAAHRIAVEWDTSRGIREGVYIPRRDTSSRLNSLVGGRLFPGVHHRARFNVRERADRLRVELESLDGLTKVIVDAPLAASLPSLSIFRSLREASEFFERGALGYSATSESARFEALELRSFGWRVEPLAVSAVASSYFEDQERFPQGSVEFDCALLMRNIAHEWHAQEELCLPKAVVA